MRPMPARTSTQGSRPWSKPRNALDIPNYLSKCDPAQASGQQLKPHAIRSAAARRQQESRCPDDTTTGRRLAKCAREG
eukprot:3375517-Alexandrium_andersonii.AAC.1